MWKNLKRKDHSRELDINDRIILKVILHKYMTVSIGLGLLTTPSTCVTPQLCP